MALPAKRVPESVAHLDVEIVAAALIHNDANIGNAARALGVPSGDLRKLVLVDQRLADAALEAIELRLDDAEANLGEALHSENPRRRDAVSIDLGHEAAAAFDAAIETLAFEHADLIRPSHLQNGTRRRRSSSNALPRNEGRRVPHPVCEEVICPRFVPSRRPSVGLRAVVTRGATVFIVA